jgi:4-hydroxy-3-methylbut-2-en-1-yl diphosphate synthase IspG/GcpE
MGCIVKGPGKSRAANISIGLKASQKAMELAYSFTNNDVGKIQPEPRMRDTLSCSNVRRIGRGSLIVELPDQ